MNGNGAMSMPYSSPPPSYREAVSETPSYTEAVSGTPSYTEAVLDTLAPVHRMQVSHLPNATSASPEVSSSDPPGQPAVVSRQPQSLAAISMHEHHYWCPPGAEPLLGVREVLVYPGKGRVYKIKDSLKQLILTAKEKEEGECCDCCSASAYQKRYTLRTIDLREVALMRRFVDSINFFSAPDRHMDIKVLPDAPIGRIHTHGNRKYTISNTSGDMLFTVKRESGFLSQPPFQIFTDGGEEIGNISCGHRGKHRLQFPLDLQVQHKLLLLCLAISLQDDADESRRDSSS
ncbi:uncharacterized protein [Procambarus clarkii]|uniref:uncharacterized protein isoform X2 n=1 Tax=Procambarus clarkii TaxID=6728 RepID=UPI001E672EFD|nr:uncharacterized protein LOC123767169 isoform X2 [Procambarus clarkii]